MDGYDYLKVNDTQYRTKVNIQEDFIRNKYLTSPTHFY